MNAGIRRLLYRDWAIEAMTEFIMESDHDVKLQLIELWKVNNRMVCGNYWRCL